MDFGNPSDRDYVPAYGAVECNQTWCDEVNIISRINFIVKL